MENMFCYLNIQPILFNLKFIYGLFKYLAHIKLRDSFISSNLHLVLEQIHRGHPEYDTLKEISALNTLQVAHHA